MEPEIDVRDKPIRVALAGLGAIGRQHARLLSELSQFDLVACCDTSAEAQAEARDRYNVPTVSNWQELLAFEPECVVNALPTHLHFESTRYFLESGLDVLVEKPIASDTSEAREVTKLATEASRVLLVGHVERFNAGVVALKEQISNGRLGEIISVVTRRVGISRPVIPHANVALDLAIHDVDVVRFLLDQPGHLITSFGSVIGQNQVEDHVDLVLRYGKTFCTVQANWITPVKIRRLSVTGTKGMAELDFITQQLRIYETAPALIEGQPWNFFAVSSESEPIDQHVLKSEPLRDELRHFAKCIMYGEQPLVPAEHATDALDLVVTATENIHSGEPVSANR
jgi:UDP-N-acetylglucosamine 3-dehydrogenase